MAKPPYQINNDDIGNVCKYLDSVFTLDYFRESQGHYDYNEYSSAQSEYHKCRSAKCLQSWCDNWLTVEQWGRLKNAVKMRRSRTTREKKTGLLSDKFKEDTVTINKSAKSALRVVRNIEKLTYGEIVEKYIGPIAEKYLEKDSSNNVTTKKGRRS